MFRIMIFMMLFSSRVCPSGECMKSLISALTSCLTVLCCDCTLAASSSAVVLLPLYCSVDDARNPADWKVFMLGSCPLGPSTHSSSSATLPMWRLELQWVEMDEPSSFAWHLVQKNVELQTIVAPSTSATHSPPTSRVRIMNGGSCFVAFAMGPSCSPMF